MHKSRLSKRAVALRNGRRLRTLWARHGRQAVMAFALAGLDAATLAHGQAAGNRAPVKSIEPGRAGAASPDARWKESFAAFAAADRLQAPQPGGVLFVGSSSIRLWDHLKEDFASLPVVTQRGFGGSRLADCSDHIALLVVPYKPRLVIVYAGDNDLAEGASPTEVLATFARFVQGVRQELPDTRIAYLSIKPSPARAAMIERVKTTNALIEAYTAQIPNLDYIDIYTLMLGADGQPRADLFGPDMLHLNRSGYAVWRRAISAHLGPHEDAPGPAPSRSELDQTTTAGNVPRASY